ncbi:hypothetical protein PVL29_021016 [Vitis rotundifolia]|uniref:Uncharacterized protein n=1 Tax=Vitis rotundifolia TaxID=103349 RepID=A0AA39DCF1_VITRO|nr:hypothetical protein PVL29_021016 [Vitis rotundifolia]
MCHIPHYFHMLTTLHATISISNSTILYPGHPSSILIAITIVGDHQLLHNASLQRYSSTQDCHTPLPHHHRPSPTITTFITKSFPLFKKTLSTAMEIHVASLHQVATTRCMTNQIRVKMVAKQIRRELFDMLLTYKVLQFAILLEATLGANYYLSSLTTISDVEVSANLQVAIAGLKSNVEYIRSELGRHMKLRLTPEICFIEDEIKNEKKMAESQDQLSESSDFSQDDDWEVMVMTLMRTLFI